MEKQQRFKHLEISSLIVVDRAQLSRFSQGNVSPYNFNIVILG